MKKILLCALLAALPLTGFAKSTCDVKITQKLIHNRDFKHLGTFLSDTKVLLSRYEDSEKACRDMLFDKLKEGDSAFQSYLLTLTDVKQKTALMSAYGVYQKLIDPKLSAAERKPLLVEYYDKAIEFNKLAFPQWIYDENKDEMRGVTTYTYSVMSTNTHKLSPPYGEVFAQITLYQVEKDGKVSSPKIGIGVTTGQIHFQADSITFKFDDDKDLMTFYGETCGDKNNIFCFKSDMQPLLETFVEGSSKTMLEVPFYGDGAQQFKFDTAGLAVKYPTE